MTLILKKIWDWLKDGWKWVALGVAVLFGYLLVSRKPVVVVSPRTNPDREDEEDKVERKKEEADRDRSLAVVEAKEEHKRDLDALESEQQERAEKLQEEGKAVQEFLLSVGRDVRKP